MGRGARGLEGGGRARIDILFRLEYLFPTTLLSLTFQFPTPADESSASSSFSRLRVNCIFHEYPVSRIFDAAWIPEEARFLINFTKGRKDHRPTSSPPPFRHIVTQRVRLLAVLNCHCPWTSHREKVLLAFERTLLMSQIFPSRSCRLLKFNSVYPPTIYTPRSQYRAIHIVQSFASPLVRHRTKYFFFSRTPIQITQLLPQRNKCPLKIRRNERTAVLQVSPSV